jgi:multisubunit Na+/H+ antiporter MnhC subunit
MFASYQAVLGLLHPETAPFLFAIGLMVLLLLLELVTLLIGFSLTEHAGGLLSAHAGIDHDADGSDLGVFGQCLSWLHVGRIPLLVILTLLLVGFALAGLSLQYAIHACFGFMLNTSIASVIAAGGSLVFTRHVGALVARAVPAVQSSALSDAELVGLTGEIVGASALKGVPGQAKVVDRFGQAHYVRVEPASDADALHRGKRLVIVERVSDSLYRAAPF